MAEKSGFFDAHLVNGEYDRVYLAENFAKYFASFISNGVFGGKSSELMVQQKATPDMSVRVLPGQGWINGYWYENDSELSLAIDVADGVLNRIDVIVLRWNNIERVIRLAVKKGTPASNPSAPAIQRDADYYELKLAQILIKAGATRISQLDITDTRLNEDVCGFVVGVVQQLDTQEFGKQLGYFVEEFIENSEAWFSGFKSESNSKVNTFLTENQTKVNKLLSDGQTNIAKVASDGTTNINALITTKRNELDKLISDGENDVAALLAELEGLIDENELAALNTKIVSVTSRVITLETDVEKLKSLFVESGPNPGCYYRVVHEGDNQVNEWINPPGEIGIEYRTTERWFGNPVYQKSFYVGALPNKTFMAIETDINFRKAISITGFAIDVDNNLFYPFPVIINGLTPSAVIQSLEGDGGDNSVIIIQTNDDISHMYGCITVKYTKL